MLLELHRGLSGQFTDSMSVSILVNGRDKPRNMMIPQFVEILSNEYPEATVVDPKAPFL